MKIAANQFRKQWIKKHGVNPLRLFVHDEVIIETEEFLAKEAAEVLEKIMVDVAETMHEGIPAVASVYIGKSWAIKK
jgi:DNA polymerase I-like protein with 3'-5' exonuclease and polymerase domains